jgi:hypothetical protein
VMCERLKAPLRAISFSFSFLETKNEREREREREEQRKMKTGSYQQLGIISLKVSAQFF